MQAMTDRFDRTDTGPAVLDVDRLLTEFYQAEMPDPWPQVCSPLAPREDGALLSRSERATIPFRRPVARYPRTFRRLAVAAALVLALIGYWAVAGFFPRD